MVVSGRIVRTGEDIKSWAVGGSGICSRKPVANCWNTFLGSSEFRVTEAAWECPPPPKKLNKLLRLVSRIRDRPITVSFLPPLRKY